MTIKGKATVKYNNGNCISPKGKLSIADVSNLNSIEGGGKIEFDDIEVDMFSYKGMVQCNSLKVQGDLSISGGLKAKQLQAGGSLSIVFSNDISVSEISASSIKIVPIEEAKFNAFASFVAKLLNTEISTKVDIMAKFKSVKGDEVELKDCNADMVVCKNIKLRGKCKIKRLICNGDVKIFGDNVKVLSQEK